MIPILGALAIGAVAGAALGSVLGARKGAIIGALKARAPWAPNPFQQVTWKSPIFFACDLLNTPSASGVGCNSTLQPFFAK
jgi:hypothetical protein